MNTFRMYPLSTCALAVISLSACMGGSSDFTLNTLPTGVTHVSTTNYPATTTGSGSSASTQDLLTAGLGKTGLGGGTPAYVDPLSPTALELRRNAIYSNYRGLVDPTANGGYGTFYGPNVAVDGSVTTSEGLIPGNESLGVLDDGSGRKQVTMAVQVPDSFDTSNPCIVVAPSSGSRGVYGAVGVASEWGLKHNCAVALTDAGKGMGLYDPADDTVHKIDGTRSTRTLAGALATFAANITDTARTAFNAAFPNRFALKQAHSQQNPEKDWGTDTLAAVKYALYVLNEQYGDPVSSTGRRIVKFTPGNTLVIAAAVSNGGGAVLKAAEADTEGLIDGVVAGEPQVQPSSTAGYSVNFNGSAVSAYGKNLFDYFTYANLYQPCAALSSSASMGAEVSFHNYISFAALTTNATNRCSALAAAGLVTGATTAAQADDALAKLRNYGWTTDNDTMHSAHYGLGNAAIITMMYANAYGKFALEDNVCGLSMAPIDGSATGNVAAISAASKAQSYAVGNGTANGAPLTVIYNNSVGGAKSWLRGVSPTSNTADFSLDSAICLRALSTGTNPLTGAALTALTTPTLAQSQAVQSGIAAVQANGNLRGKPTLVIQGRSDALLPINHTGRAYSAFNKKVEGNASQVSYIEVTNAQHFDSFISLSGFDTRYIPLHVYFLRGLDSMYAKLKSGTALPPSQVVRTTARGGSAGAAPALTSTNVPAYATSPAVGNTISITSTSISVPN